MATPSSQLETVVVPTTPGARETETAVFVLSGLQLEHHISTWRLLEMGVPLVIIHILDWEVP